MKSIKIAFIGCGRISDLHALGYADHNEAAITAVCDTNALMAEKKQHEWGAEYWTDDYHRILNDPDIDAVEILTPQKLHEKMTVEAFKAGKHVLVQKPMSIDLASADRMIQASERNGKILKIMENYIYYPPIIEAHNLIESGMIGNPISMRIKFISGSSGGWNVPVESWAWRMEENAEGRGMQTFDHGFHMWSTAWYLMGEVERVKAWIDSYNNIVDCPSMIMWKFKESVIDEHRKQQIEHKNPDLTAGTDHIKHPKYGICDYTHSYELSIPSDYYANDEWIEITGSKGIIKINRCTGRILSGPALSLFTSSGWKHFNSIESDWSAGFISATRNFIDAIQGRDKPRLSGPEGKEIMKFNLAVQLSSRERREVYLDELTSDKGMAFSYKKIEEDQACCASRAAIPLEELKKKPRML